MIDSKAKTTSSKDKKNPIRVMDVRLNDQSLFEATDVKIARGDKFTTLIGTNKSDNAAILSFSTDLSPGNHKVIYPKDVVEGIRWQVSHDGKSYMAHTGSMDLTVSGYAHYRGDAVFSTADRKTLKVYFALEP
jgi:hypothetical protein